MIRYLFFDRYRTYILFQNGSGQPKKANYVKKLFSNKYVFVRPRRPVLALMAHNWHTLPPLIMWCVLQPYYVDEDDFWKACDQNQPLVIDKYLSTGGDVNASDTVSDPISQLALGRFCQLALCCVCVCSSTEQDCIRHLLTDTWRLSKNCWKLVPTSTARTRY